MSHHFALFAPFVGARSETFIRRHACDLLPGRTVVVTGDATGHYSGHWSVAGPALALNTVHHESTGSRLLKAIARRVGRKPQDDPVTMAVSRFLREHHVRVAMGEFLSWSLRWVPLARKLAIPFFGHAHGYDVSADLRHAKWRDAYLMFNETGGIITMSEVSRSRLIDVGLKPEKVYVIPYGVIVPPEPQTRAEGEQVRVLAVGRMTAKKAPILVLDAFRRAVEANRRLRLDYVGEGELLPAAQQFVHAFALEDRVTLHGGQSSEHVMSLMQRADIFMQHSVTDPVTGDEEGLPVAILEAMAQALPVVSTRHAGIPEAVVDGVTGILVDEGKIREMAEGLILLARDSALRRSMGVSGWKVAHERFSWSRERAHLQKVLGLSQSN